MSTKLIIIHCGRVLANASRSSTLSKEERNYRYQPVSESFYRQYCQLFHESVYLSGVHYVLIRRCGLRVNFGSY